MNELDQARHHAARRLVDLLDYADHDGDPAIATQAALATVEAIANYAGINLLDRLMPDRQKNRREP